MSIHVSKRIRQLAEIGKRLANGTFEKFCSDGSRHPSKCCTGELFRIGRSDTGLRLYVMVGNKVRVVNWRMRQQTVDGVLAYVYKNAYRADGTHRLS